MGDAVCLFPEGMSRYHPTIAPLKTGGVSRPYSCLYKVLTYPSTVARLVSDVLTRNRYNPDFEIDVLTCSITYMYGHWLYMFVPNSHSYVGIVNTSGRMSL